MLITISSTFSDLQKIRKAGHVERLNEGKNVRLFRVLKTGKLSTSPYKDIYGQTRFTAEEAQKVKLNFEKLNPGTTMVIVDPDAKENLSEKSNLSTTIWDITEGVKVITSELTTALLKNRERFIENKSDSVDPDVIKKIDEFQRFLTDIKKKLA